MASAAPRRRPYAPRLAPEARREQLLDAAMHVISRDGYAAVNIEAVAREADVTRPVVYGSFEDLGALLFALLERQEQRALDQLMAAVPADLGELGPDAFLSALIRRLVAVVQDDPLTWRPILLAPEGTPAIVRERIARDRELVRERTAGLLAAGLALRGGPDLDVEISSHALLAVAEYFGRLLLEDPEKFDVDRLVEAVESLLAALTAPPG
ncbi:MAG: TetR/AcrR family transcriptional regulator [Solirubrobacteraceae bacterium]|nr:TetR/AcrR family transcriptional regulator [Solirubrobacteraceae bacterium]